MAAIFGFSGFTMKLTIKDKDFLQKLKALFKSKDLSIELKSDGLKRFVLRQNYGDKVESYFDLTRQGIRWRFQRLFNEIYISSYETIYWLESSFGTDLRPKAIEIAKERVELRQKAHKTGLFVPCRRETGSKTPASKPLRLQRDLPS